MDGKAVCVEISREIVAAVRLEGEVAADVLRQPARDLDPADVLADRVVRAALGHQHAVAAAQVVDGARAGGEGFQVAFVAREEDAERRHRDARWRVGRDFEERLRIADDQIRRAAEAREQRRQFAFLHHQRRLVAVEQVADGLHLRQDEPAARRFFIDRHHQHGEAAGRQQVAGDCGWIEPLRRADGDQRRAQVVDAAAFDRAGDGVRQAGIAQVAEDHRIGRGAVGLRQCDDDARVLGFRLGEERLFDVAPVIGARSEHGDVGAVEHLPCARHALRAEFADVVEAGGVDQLHRAERLQLHGFLHRIGGGAGHVRDDRHLLAGERVHQRRLAGIAPAEEGDVEARAAGSCVHTASERPSVRASERRDHRGVGRWRG